MATLIGQGTIPLREAFRSLEQPPTRFHPIGIARVSIVDQASIARSQSIREGRMERVNSCLESLLRSTLVSTFVSPTQHHSASNGESRMHLAESVLARLLGSTFTRREKIHTRFNDIQHNTQYCIKYAQRRSSPLGGRGTRYCYGTRLLRAKRRSRFPRHRATDRLGRSGMFLRR